MFPDIKSPQSIIVVSMFKTHFTMKEDIMMSEGRISCLKGDPSCVLRMLDQRLGRDGNVTDVVDVVPILEIMEDAKLLADRCIFIDILRVTRNRTVLLKFIEDGGWDTLYKWLQEARLESNESFIVELLKLYKHLPITVTLLKQNNCAKDIRQLIKSNDTKIGALSKEIVDSWMTKVKENGSGETSRSKTVPADKSKPGSTTSASGTSPRSDSSSSRTTNNNNNNNNAPSGHVTGTVGISVITAKPRVDSLSASLAVSRTAHTSSDKRAAPQLNNGGDSLLSSSSIANDTNSSFNSDNVVSLVSKDRPKTVKTIGSKMRSTGNDVARTALRCVKKLLSIVNISLPM